MKKQELIHYHSLLRELRNYMAPSEDESVDAPEYDALDVSPVAIHVGKGQHEDAVFSLSKSLAEVEAPEPPVQDTPRAVPADD